jgi:hypothetical protein
MTNTTNKQLTDKDKKKLIQLWIFNITVIAFAFAIYFYPQNMDQEMASQSEVQLAQRKAQQLAKWMIKNKFQFVEFQNGDAKVDEEQQVRGLASDNSVAQKVQKFKGEIGRDPWGRPFLFEVTNQGQVGASVYLLSMGENGTKETSEMTQKTSAKNGDDILVNVSIE